MTWERLGATVTSMIRVLFSYLAPHDPQLLVPQRNLLHHCNSEAVSSGAVTRVKSNIHKIGFQTLCEHKFP